MKTEIEIYIKQLTEKGYCRIPQLFSTTQIERALELVEFWHNKTTETLAGNTPYLNQNQPMVYNLQNKEFFFLDLLFATKPVEQLLVHFLNDPWFKQIPPGHPNYILRSYLGRSSKGALPLHIDSFVPYLGPFCFAMQVAIILQDMSKENGCTLVVPGSHASGSYVSQEALKDAVPIEASAGDVLIWDSRLWHGTTENASASTRWALIATYVRWWVKQAFDIPRALPKEVYVRLSDSQKAVLGFCAVPYSDETIGIDMKRSYDDLYVPRHLETSSDRLSKKSQASTRPRKTR